MARKRSFSLTRTLSWGAGIFVGAQVVTAAGLMAYESIARRHRAPKKFPSSPPEAAQVGRDAVTVFTLGQDLYDDMLDQISKATEAIYFETYIWKADSIGHRFKKALIEAAERGVEVFIVYDVFANLVVNPSFYDFPESVHVRQHPLISAWIPSIRSSGRDHRKLMVVDHRTAYVGGYNIGDDYAHLWRDTHCRIDGPGAAEIENAFVDYWNMAPTGLLKRQRGLPPLDHQVPRGWSSPVQVYRNTPAWRAYPIRSMYLEALDRATKRIWMTHAYLIPDDAMEQAMFTAVERGADVRIIVPAKSNHVVADWLSRGFYDNLLAHGVRLFLYQDAMVHAKTATVDGQWTTIGTTNLDRLSLAGNYEVNASFLSEDLAEKMERIFEFDLQNCVELTREDWDTRSLVARGTEALLSPMRPLL